MVFRSVHAVQWWDDALVSQVVFSMDRHPSINCIMLFAASFVKQEQLNPIQMETALLCIFPRWIG